MNAPYVKDTQYFLQFTDGRRLGPFSMLWTEKSTNGHTYTYGCFENNSDRHASEYALLSHGLFWLLHREDDHFAVMRIDKTWDMFPSCEVICD